MRVPSGKELSGGDVIRDKGGLVTLPLEWVYPPLLPLLLLLLLFSLLMANNLWLFHGPEYGVHNTVNINHKFLGRSIVRVVKRLFLKLQDQMNGSQLPFGS